MEFWVFRGGQNIVDFRENSPVRGGGGGGGGFVEGGGGVGGGGGGVYFIGGGQFFLHPCSYFEM